MKKLEFIFGSNSKVTNSLLEPCGLEMTRERRGELVKGSCEYVRREMVCWALILTSFDVLRVCIPLRLGDAHVEVQHVTKVKENAGVRNKHVL